MGIVFAQLLIPWLLWERSRSGLRHQRQTSGSLCRGGGEGSRPGGNAAPRAPREVRFPLPLPGIVYENKAIRYINNLINRDLPLIIHEEHLATLKLYSQNRFINQLIIN